jgi:hypothetical protein
LRTEPPPGGYPRVDAVETSHRSRVGDERFAAARLERVLP